MTQTEVIVVEDDQGVRRSLQLLLRGHGYRVKAYADAQSVAGDPEATGATLLLTDYRLESGTGFDVLRQLRGAGFGGSAVLITAFGSKELSDQAVEQGFDVVLDKPLRPSQLLRMARVATGHP